MESEFLGKPISYWMQLDSRVKELNIENIVYENCILWNRLKQKKTDTELVEIATDCGIPIEYREAILKFAHIKEKPIAFSE